MNPFADHLGITSVSSRYSVTESMDRFEALIKAHGMTVFARIDQQAEAARIDLVMRPTQLILFGNPKAGTPLMVAVPSIAIDLPVKVLAWEDQDGHVWLSFNNAEYLQQRHGLTDEQAALLGRGQLVYNALA